MGVDTADAVNKLISQLIPADADAQARLPQAGPDAVATALGLVLDHCDSAESEVWKARNQGLEEAKSNEDIEAVAAAKAAKVTSAEDHAFATTMLVQELVDVDDENAQGAAATGSGAQDAAVADSEVQAPAGSTAGAGAAAAKVAVPTEQELATKCKLDRVEVALIFNTSGGQQRVRALEALRANGVPVDKHIQEINAMDGQALLKLEKAAKALLAAKVKDQVSDDAAAPITEQDVLYLSYTACVSDQADPKWNAAVRHSQGAWGNKGATVSNSDALRATMLLVLSTQFDPAVEGLRTCPDAGKHILKGVLSLPPSIKAKFDAARGNSPFADVVRAGAGTPFTSVAIRLQRVPPPWQPTTVKITATGPAAATMTVLQLVQAVRQTGVQLRVEDVQQTIDSASASAPSTSTSDMLTAAMTAIKAATAVYEQAGGQRPAASSPPQNTCFLATLRLEDAQELPSRIQLMSAPGVATLLQVSGPGVSTCNKCGHRGHLAGACRQKRALPPVRVYSGAFNASKTRPPRGKASKAPQTKSLLHATPKRQPASVIPVAASAATAKGPTHQVVSAVAAAAEDATAAMHLQSGSNSPPACDSGMPVDDGGGPWITVGPGGSTSGSGGSSGSSGSRADAIKRDRAAKATQQRHDQARASSAAEAAGNAFKGKSERPGTISSNTARTKGNSKASKKYVTGSTPTPQGNARQAPQQEFGPHPAKAPAALTPLQTDPPEQCVRNMGLTPNVVSDDTAAAGLDNPQGRPQDGPAMSTDPVGADTPSSATGAQQAAEADLHH